MRYIGTLTLLLFCCTSDGSPAPLPRLVTVSPPSIALHNISGVWEHSFGGTPGKLWLYFPDSPIGGILEEEWGGNRYWGRWVLISTPGSVEPSLLLKDHDGCGNSWVWSTTLRLGKEGGPSLIGSSYGLVKW